MQFLMFYCQACVLGNHQFLHQSFSQTSNTSSSKVCRYALIFGYSKAAINWPSLVIASGTFKTPAGSIWNKAWMGNHDLVSWFEAELQSAHHCLLNRWQRRFLLIFRHIPSVSSVQLPPAGLGARPLQIAIRPAGRIMMPAKDTMSQKLL